MAFSEWRVIRTELISEVRRQAAKMVPNSHGAKKGANTSLWQLVSDLFQRASYVNDVVQVTCAMYRASSSTAILPRSAWKPWLCHCSGVAPNR